MKLLARYFFVPLFVGLVLAVILLRGLVQELHIGLGTRRQRLTRRYFALVFLPLCQCTEWLVRLLQN